jgi:hypothetical protein
MAARTLQRKAATDRRAPVRSAAGPRRAPYPAPAPPIPAAPGSGLDAGVARAERFGHRYESLPAPPPGAAPIPAPMQAPIQRSGLVSTIGGWLGFGGQSAKQQEQERQAELRRAAIRRAQEEAAAKRQADADKRSQELHEQEHRAYRRLDEIKGGKQHAEERQRLLRQLDGIQRAHSDHVQHLHENDLELWTPDRDRLSPANRRNLSQAWDELRHGTGLIKTPTGPGTEAINKDLRAVHARLLSGAQGRSLLYQLLDREGPATGSEVQILPRDPIQPGERARNRAAHRQIEQIEPQLARAQQELTRIMDAEGLGSMRDAATHAWQDPANQARAQQLAQQSRDLSDRLTPLRPQANPRAAAEAGPEEGGLEASNYTAAGAPGAGAGSVVNLMSGIRDSEYLNRDPEGRYIPAPAFVIYGHELIHALHNKRGRNSSGVDRDQYQQRPLDRWSDREEHNTIAGAGISENALRAEHGLTQRGSHFGIAREDLEAQRGGGGQGGGGKRRRRR